MKRLNYKKSEKYLFVDGYNIINAWGSFDKSIPLEDQRLQLADVLSEYAHTVDEKVIVVFDAYMVKKSAGAIYDYKGILVVFTKEFETADHYIERQLSEMKRVKGVRVATSDNIEQQIILSRGGVRLSAREFQVEVELSKQKISTKQKVLKKKAELTNRIDDEQLNKLKDMNL
ncbi:NYN domain-containing protein [Peptoniphilus indolicus]|uniref:Tetracycline resistance protein n=2 Tax=Peptoniphilus indolicus TaxID=33030 RepID=G4D3U3_9FIRM|nr:NYN domain-containing protein [Peptoniphilus indolicus]EGY79815.1 tetracycline resistance protein [Peptoniphilus indolicus ATCC 29427]SUB75764.1 Predicted RNA-binding protein containing a PIN domain [Peptoniphilus indolicus]